MLTTNIKGGNLPARKSGTRLVVICALLSAIVLAVYLQTGSHPFTNLDDDAYVYSNSQVMKGLTGETVEWAFTTDNEAGFWHPLTWLSHMTDVQLYGANPGGHHLTSVAIHLCSSLLLLLLLFRCTGALWQSSFVAALFALHPMHVESVAWIAERKDVLSAFFWFLTLLLYADFTVTRKPVLYVCALLSFLLGLMSKPTVVTLPVVMFLMDYWPLNRFPSEKGEMRFRQLLAKTIPLVGEKVPFLVGSLLVGITTIFAQQKVGAAPGLADLSLTFRVENAVTSYVAYIFKTLWPTDLAVLYPFPPSIPVWRAAGALLLLLIATVAVFRGWRRYPYLVVGWLWFLITLLPAIGLLQVGSQSMADRFSYIPGTGLFIMAAWGVSEAARNLKYKERVLALAAGATITASAMLTWHQLGYWKDTALLYRHTLDVTRNNWMIECNLGLVLADRGLKDQAIGHYRESIRINPNYLEPHNNLAVAYAEQGELDAAIREFRESLRIRPDFSDAHYNLGFALFQKGLLDDALQEYREALRINPGNVQAQGGMRNVFEAKRMKGE